ncbi:MAG: pilin [Candidatus Paceibacterota bacterium]|jgi:hypothetical protein
MNQTVFNTINNANDLFGRLMYLGNLIIYLLIALGVVYIVWNIVIYFIKGKEGDENRRESGKHIMWGIVGLAIILSVWGLVNILVNTFRTNPNEPRDRFPNADFVNSQSGQTNSGQYYDRNIDNRMIDAPQGWERQYENMI